MRKVLWMDDGGFHIGLPRRRSAVASRANAQRFKIFVLDLTFARDTFRNVSQGRFIRTIFNGLS
ncbi:MAG: hypothetical protein Rhims3KO_35570 [Hyphomicrobiales bacterium]